MTRGNQRDLAVSPLLISETVIFENKLEFIYIFFYYNKKKIAREKRQESANGQTSRLGSQCRSNA